MSKPFLKKKSKKILTKTRCKIQKKVREHNRKVRRDAKKKGNTKKKVEIPVPNKAPFKEEMLQKSQKLKEEKKEEMLKKKEKKRKLKAAVKQQLNNKGRNAGKIEKLVQQAQEKQRVFESKKKLTEPPDFECLYKANASTENSLKAYFSEVKKVLEAADVVIQVVDARDPIGGRCPQVEEAVKSAGKRLILLMNKIDLIPKENIEKWLKYFRQQVPTIAFRSSTQEQAHNLGSGARDPTSTSKCVGADLLMKLLGNYCRNKDIKTRIMVGIVGFPNVGKSSVINSLKRSRSCQVGATPGITKAVQEIELDKKIRLLDTPGVVMASRESGDFVDVALRNAVRIESLPDPITPVEGILRRCTKDSLILQYNIPDFEDTVEFLGLIAQRLGKLKKGGIPDTTSAARQVLRDWNIGKIRYYTEPPEIVDDPGSTEFSIVEAMSKEFNLDEINQDQSLLLEQLPAMPATETSTIAKVLSRGMSDGLVVESESSMETDENNPAGKTRIDQSHLASRSASPPPSGKVDVEMTITGNQQIGKNRKAELKRSLKKKKRSDKFANKLSESLTKALDTFMDTKDAYDFTETMK